MLDFKRIGGEIVSSPLNENFRKLRNDISISNTNLVFSETDPVKDTVHDMLDIKDPVNAQVCYVVSSGELYRYAIHDKEWHKIADFGQTFRQGFLNSGAVVLDKHIELKSGTQATLQMPEMLVYFKSQPGDEKYLKGMYAIKAQEIDVSSSISKSSACSIILDSNHEYKIMTGMPRQDNPKEIFIGTFLVDKDKNILEDFIYTLPDIAYTGDRGQFLLNGGQASGLNLGPGTSGNLVNRSKGQYYDEGINFLSGDIDKFPVNTDTGANYNLKLYEAQVAPTLYYLNPSLGLESGIVESEGLIVNKYWDVDKGVLQDVKDGFFTIQQHIVTPNGQNIILYGTAEYNSMTDAMAHINDTHGIDIDFPYVETTRIIAGNVENFTTSDVNACSFRTLERISQLGTISPKFADSQFEIYSGDTNDYTPATIKLDLTELQKEPFEGKYNLVVAPYTTTRYEFALPKKYSRSTITDGEEKEITEPMVMTTTEKRESYGPGYQIADVVDIEKLRQRVNAIETEIWATENTPGKDNRHNQAVRYRLFHVEYRLDDHDKTLEEYGARLTWLEENKVNKKTTINGYALGENNDKDEENVITLYTKDIQEPEDATEEEHWWFKHERVRQNDWVIESHNHAGTKSSSEGLAEEHIKVNPHNLTTDDLEILDESNKLFVSSTQLSAIENLPDDTTGRLDEIDAKHIETIPIDKILKSSATIEKVGDVKGIRFKEDGVVLSTADNGTTLVVECKGQVDGERVMMRNDYAARAMQDGHSKTVDDALKAHEANAIQGVTEAGNNKYYGTDTEGLAGFHSISWVSCKDIGQYGGTDITTFEPEAESIKEEHLDADLIAKINNNYHTIIQDGIIIREDINTFEFDSSFEIKPKDSGSHTITIKGGGGTGPTGATSFATLSDVDVIYTGNAGKTLVVNESGTGIKLTETPSLTEYMLEKTYVDPLNVNNVLRASNADNADKAKVATDSEAVNGISIGNDKTSSSLWTSDKIISNTSTQIQNEGVRTYSGTSVPNNSLGKNGDIYILIEG